MFLAKYRWHRKKTTTLTEHHAIYGRVLLALHTLTHYNNNPMEINIFSKLQLET